MNVTAQQCLYSSQTSFFPTLPALCEVRRWARSWERTQLTENDQRDVLCHVVHWGPTFNVPAGRKQWINALFCSACRHSFVSLVKMSISTNKLFQFCSSNSLSHPTARGALEPWSGCLAAGQVQLALQNYFFRCL